MKKFSVIMMACLMALGMTQCKKETTPTTQENGVKITLKVGNTSNTRVDVNPNYNDIYAKVNFEVGDIVYVGYNNTKVGELTCQSIGSDPNINVNATFEGTVNIDDYDGEKPLHFYLLGGKDFVPTFEGNTATVNISDQSAKYPVVSYAVSNEPFTGAGNYTTKMMNKCSILKFNVTKPSNANDAIYINGMNNVVTVDFTNPDGEDNGFAYSMTDYGRIKMRPVVSTTDTDPVDMWVIVLPQAELTTTGYAYNEGKTCAGLRPVLPQIERNKYMKEGIDMNLNDLAISVSPTEKVYFAPGNLQYSRNATYKWRFAEHQYDIIGSWSINNEWVDLFGFGTWTKNVQPSEPGYDFNTEMIVNPASGNPQVPRPLMYWAEAPKYTWGNQDFVDEPNSEFGTKYNWVTLEQGGWEYALQTRGATMLNGVGDARFAKAKVAGVQGLILFPDAYAHPDGVTLPNANSINVKNMAFATNNYTTDDWNEMEKFGAVFLPCAGYRNGSSIPSGFAGVIGYYYSRSGSDARALLLSGSNVNPTYSPAGQQYFGYSVRLVRVRE